EIEVEVPIERWVDCTRRHSEQQRAAVRRRLQRKFGANIGAGTWPVVHHKRLSKFLRQPLPDQARDEVGRTAGPGGHDQAYWPRRIIKCPCGPQAVDSERFRSAPRTWGRFQGNLNVR